jgi:diadenylate cyclase
MFELFQVYWRSILEVMILAVGMYLVLRFIQGTRGARVLLGLVALLLLLTVVSVLFDLRAMNWFLGHLYTIGAVALVIIFQPELRHALAEIGSRSILLSGPHERDVVEILVKASLGFSARKVGALIAIEREIALKGVAEGGAAIDARLSVEILDQIFYPNSPLHDGGVLIQGNRVLSAATIFPLTSRTDLAKSVGTRHRAALGLSEESDAAVLVVSEETGSISLASQSTLHQNLNAEQLRKLLSRLILGGTGEPSFKINPRVWITERLGLKLVAAMLALLFWLLINDRIRFHDEDTTVLQKHPLNRILR